MDSKLRVLKGSLKPIYYVAYRADEFIINMDIILCPKVDRIIYFYLN